MSARLRRAGTRSWVTVTALLAVTTFLVGQTQAVAKHTPEHAPANKVAVAGSADPEGVVAGDPGQTVELLRTSMRNAASKGLLLQVTLECSILTALQTVGSDTANAKSALVVWVEVNGRPVGVTDEDAEGLLGRVTFCNREYQRTTLFVDDAEHVIDDYIRTKQAHGFNWVDLEAGAGVQEIVVWGMLTATGTDDCAADPQEGPVTKGCAEVLVGQRTLVVEPVDVAHDESKAN